MRSSVRNLLFALAATSSAFLTTRALAQTVNIADPRPHQCDRDDVACDDHKAFSLAALESGLIHLPVDSHASRDFVLVNDTGSPVKLLRFSYFGTLESDAHLRCQINGTVHRIFDSCTLSGAPGATSNTLSDGSADHDRDSDKDGDKNRDHDRDGDNGRDHHDNSQAEALVNSTVEFTYVAGSQQTGIPTGAYFDIRTAEFDEARGYLSGLAQPPASSCTAAQTATAGPAAKGNGGHGSPAVVQSTPAICWSSPASITYGTPLSSTQLNATASVAGYFSYSPGSGAMLNPGTQTLMATFTPADTVDYTPAVATRTITVNEATQTVLTAVRGPDANYPVVLTVTVTALPSGQPAPGLITIYDTTNWVQAAVPLTNGQVTWVVPANLMGLTVYAVYAGEGSLAPSTSAPLSGPAEMAILYPAN